MFFSEYISEQLFNTKLVNDIFKFEYSNYDKGRGKSSEKKGLKNTGRLKFKSIFRQINPFCNDSEEKQKKKLYDFAVKQISDRLNLTFILNKMLEIEKLKILLLSENQ